MTGAYLIDIKYQRNYLDEEQAYFYLLVAEDLARRAMFEDNVADQLRREQGVSGPLRDNLCEQWRQPIYFPVDGGSITVRLEDLNSKFNLNTLVRHQYQPKGGSTFPFTPEQQIFVRLLQTFDQLEIDTQAAQEIAEAVYDWMDANSEAQGFGGMEDADYSAEGLNYRTPNSGMASVSELKLIPRISSSLYRVLRDYVTVWPPLARLGRPDNSSSLNVNTISSNLMRALPKNLGLAPVEHELVRDARNEQRRGWPAQNISETLLAKTRGGRSASANCGFRSMSHFNAMMPGGADNPYINLVSHQVMASSQIVIGDITRKMETVLHRVKRNADTVVWGRAFGSL